MKANDSYSYLKIRKKPWYVWLLRLVWVAWLVFWAEVAIGSWKELESRAFAIALIIFLVSLILGFLIWLWRKRRE